MEVRTMCGVRVAVALFLAAGWALAGPPTPAGAQDAEAVLKARTAEMERQKAEEVAKARAEAERKVTLEYQAKLAEVRRQLVEERARAAELSAKVDDLTGILKAIPPSASVPTTPKEWGRPVFSDDFSRDDISDRWDKAGLQPPAGQFKVVDGMLTGKDRIATLQRFTGKAVRVEYDTWTIAPNPSDASMYLLDREKDFSAFAGIGGEMNRVCTLKAGGKVLAQKERATLARGRRQHMVVECGGGKMRIEVDGETVLEYQGDGAPAKVENAQLALYAWTPGMHFDNVRVYVVQEQAK
jgi:hypothetical protein